MKKEKQSSSEPQLPSTMREGVYGILMRGNEVLMCHTRSGNRIIKNFPGGQVDQNESLEVALVREFKEEIGVELATVEYFHISSDLDVNPDYPDNRILLHYCWVETAEEVKLQGNGADVATLEWVSIENFPWTEMLEPDAEVGRMLLESARSQEK